MKRKWIHAALGLMVTAAVFSSAAFSVSAAQTEETESAQTEDSAEETELTFEVDGTEMSMVNKTGAEVTSVTAEEEEADASEGEAAEDTDGDEETAYTVTVVTADGSHIFEKADPAAWTDAELVEENGFFYVQYTDADGKDAEAAETADAVTPEETLTMWTTAKLNVREEPDTDAEVLTVAALGGECEVVSILPGWYEVKYGDVQGYVSHKYLSSDKEAVDALVEEAEQAAAAAQAAASADSYSYSGSGSSDTSSAPAASTQDPAQCLDNGLLN